MSYSSSVHQRDIYKLVDTVTSGNFKSELDFLKKLVKEIVSHPLFEIIGGRVWELNPTDRTYELRYQYGKLKKIPKDFKIDISEYPVLGELIHIRTGLQQETNTLLREKGIEIYSVTAVGEIYRVGGQSLYKYVLGFNAPHILQSVFENLNIISSVASVRLRDLSYTEKSQKLQRDILKASEIQRNLLPRHDVEFKDYKVFGACIPDSDVGGDYFDYLKSSDEEDERLGIVISDAASKGLPAAIQSLFVSGAIRMSQSFSPKISALMNRLNTLIFDTFPYERFVTLVYCELTANRNRLALYANAGHCSPIHYIHRKNEFEFLEATGGLLGIVRNQTFSVENFNMEPADILVLYTDGISEAHDKNGKMFGEERICDLIRQYRDESARDIAYIIIEEVEKFSIDGLYNDDKTIVVVKRDPVDRTPAVEVRPV